MTAIWITLGVLGWSAGWYLGFRLACWDLGQISPNTDSDLRQIAVFMLILWPVLVPYIALTGGERKRPSILRRIAGPAERNKP